MDDAMNLRIINLDFWPRSRKFRPNRKAADALYGPPAATHYAPEDLQHLCRGAHDAFQRALWRADAIPINLK